MEIPRSKTNSDSQQQIEEQVRFNRKRQKELQKDSETELANLRAAYKTERESLQGKSEQAQLDFQQKSYQQMGEVQNRLKTQLKDLKDKEETELFNKQTSLKQQLSEVDRAHEKSIYEQKDKFGKLQEFETRKASADLLGLKEQNDLQKNLLTQSHTDWMQQNAQAIDQQQKNIFEQKNKALEDSQKLFADQIQANQTSHVQKLSALAANSNERIEKIARSNEKNLNQYSELKNDPFYQEIRLNPQIQEHEEYFRITAQVPKHEQANIRAVPQGDKFVISGSRQMNETHTDPLGVKRTTSGYQSFSEAVPLSAPVDANRMVSQFNGETMEIIVPKQRFKRDDEKASDQKLKKETIAKVRVERPQFPNYLVNKVETKKT